MPDQQVVIDGKEELVSSRGQLLPATIYISDCEPALLYSEQDLQSPDSRGFHRYRIFHVLRNDEPYEYREDMGVAEQYVAPPLRIPAGGGERVNGTQVRYWSVHSVRELREIAEEWHVLHATPPIWEPSQSLIEGYQHYNEKLGNHNHQTTIRNRNG